MVPKNWSKVGFGEVVSLSKSRHNPKTSNNSYPCIELEHIEQGTGRIIGSTPSSSLNSTKSKFKKGDVIFGKLRPYLRKYAMPSFNGVCSTEIWVFKPSDKILKPYLYHLIQTSHFISEANKSSGSKMPRADWDVISEMVINLPPLPEQQKIAKILSTWDKAISTTERLIDNSTQQKKALIQQLLTGKKRLLDDDGKRFEGEWEEVRLEDHLESFQNGYAFKASHYEETGIPIITMGNIGLDGKFNERLSKVNYWSYDKALERYEVNNGDLLIAMTDVTPDKNLIGRMTIVTTDKTFYLNQRVGLIKPKPTLDKHFLRCLSNDVCWRRYSLAVSASGVQANMSTKDIKNGTIKLPSFKEQQKIAAVLTNADKEIELLEQQLADLQQEKKALMQVLLTGKKRVRIDG